MSGVYHRLRRVDQRWGRSSRRALHIPYCVRTLRRILGGAITTVGNLDTLVSRLAGSLEPIERNLSSRSVAPDQNSAAIVVIARRPRRQN